MTTEQEMTERLRGQGFTPEQIETGKVLASEWIDGASLVEVAPGVVLGSCKRCGSAVMIRDDEAGAPDTAFARHVKRHTSSSSLFGGF